MSGCPGLGDLPGSSPPASRVPSEQFPVLNPTSQGLPKAPSPTWGQPSTGTMPGPSARSQQDTSITANRAGRDMAEKQRPAPQTPLAGLRSHGLVASDLLLSPSSHPCIPALQPLPGCACTVGPCRAVGYPTQPEQPPSPRAGSGIVRWVVFRKDGSSQRPGGDKCFFHSLVLMDSQRWEAAANTSPASQESQPQQSSAGSALPAPASQPCLSPALLGPPRFPPAPGAGLQLGIA